MPPSFHIELRNGRKGYIVVRDRCIIQNGDDIKNTELREIEIYNGRFRSDYDKFRFDFIISGPFDTELRKRGSFFKIKDPKSYRFDLMEFD